MVVNFDLGRFAVLEIPRGDEPVSSVGVGGVESSQPGRWIERPTDRDASRPGSVCDEIDESISAAALVLNRDLFGDTSIVELARLAVDRRPFNSRQAVEIATTAAKLFTDLADAVSAQHGIWKVVHGHVLGRISKHRGTLGRG